MNFDPKIHHRSSHRRKGYDYSLPGAYFVTVVTRHRDTLFGEIKQGKMNLNRRGEIVRDEWFASTKIRSEIFLNEDEFVVMPNHIHGIVWIVETSTRKNDVYLEIPDKSHIPHESNNRISISANVAGTPVGATGRSPLQGFPRGPKPRSLSSFLAGYKSSVSTRIRLEMNETGIWQRNYHDRVLRSDRELQAVRRYIQTNPVKWTEDSLSATSTSTSTGAAAAG